MNSIKNHKLKILLLENLAEDAELLKQELTTGKISFQIEIATTREAFLKALENFKPEIIFANYSNPNFDGISALEIVRKRNRSIPFIFVSEAVGEETTIETFNKGATDFVLKDRLSRLVPAVKRALKAAQESENKFKTQAALRENEYRLQKILNSVQAGIIIIDAETQMIVDANPAACKLINATCEKILGSACHQFICPDEEIQGPVCDLGKEVNNSEGILYTKQGNKIPIIKNVIKTELNNRTFIIASFLRIADHKNAEKKIREQNEFLKTVLESLTHPFYIIDANNYNIKLGNSASRFSSIAKNSKCYALTHNSDQPCNTKEHPCPVKEVKKYKKPICVEHIHYLSGDTKPRNYEIHAYPIFDEKKNVSQIIEYALDITDRKEAEKALLESEEKYRKFIEEDLTGDFLAKPDGTILFCNQAFVSIFGYESIKEVFNSNIVQLYSNPEIWDKQLELIRRKKKIQFDEFELRTRRGKPLFAAQNIIGSFNAENELEEIRGYIFDITERKTLEAQFRQAQKLEAIGQLAGGVAHDLNNILTVINGFAQLGSMKYEKKDKISKFFKEILGAGERAEELTSQLLAFSRKQIIEPKIISINNTITSMGGMLRRLIGENMKLSLDLSENIVPVKADQTQLEQVLMNLIVNARDAILDPRNKNSIKKITITTKDALLDESYSHSHIGLKPGNYVEICVSDTGVGIDKNMLSNIFDPFFTTKEQGKGTGLGLSTVYGIIKQNNGDIHVYSENGMGTIFRIYWPAVEKELSVRETKELKTGIGGGQETILVAEDDPKVRGFVHTILTSLGYQVYSASGGSEALKIAQKNEKEISLLFTDIVMPEMDGRELARKLSEKIPDLKVLFTSGYSDDYISHDGILEHNVQFISKPFSAQRLAKKIRTILDGKLKP